MESCPAKGKTCNNCKKPNHFESVCKSKKSKGVSSILFSTIHKINYMSAEQEGSLPKLNVLIGIDNDEAPVMTEVVADTGAQATVAGYQHLRHLGIKQKDLRTPTHSLRHAGGSNLEILGSYPIYIIHNDKLIEDEIYFVKGVKNLYLSLASCKGISIVHKNFPDINIALESPKLNIDANIVQPKIPSISETKESIETDSLGRKVPIRPTPLPFPASEENITKLEKWLLDEFHQSTFNTMDPIPHLAKPLNMHLNGNAIPHADYTPLPTPPHFREEMMNQLKKDVHSKILRKFPVGEANEWCARMVTAMKKDGCPRRTIDFQKLNEQCQREAYHSHRPFDVVSNIPTKTYKTVLDAYNGYHQVLLDDVSAKLTTFITDLGGRYQCLCAPQGFKVSGDGFNRRYDDIIIDQERKAKVVDDTVLWDADITEAFYHTFDFLLLCANNGVTLKPEKIKFCRRDRLLQLYYWVGEFSPF